MNGRLIEAESLGGYLEAKPGRYPVFYLVVNGASAQNIDDALKVFNDLSEIAAILQEDASHQGGASQSDQQSKGAASRDKGGDEISGDCKHRMNGFT